MEDRRGFLKTLGKLTAALGITTAACSAHHHGHHHPDPHPKHPTKAKIRTPDKAELDTFVPRDALLDFKPDGSVVRTPITHAANVCVTGKRPNTMLDVGEATAEAQKAIDALHNLRLDNASFMSMNPPTFMPTHIRDFVMQKEAIRSLDPYNWGEVFDLKWVDWNQPDPSWATTIGRWEARVKPRFQGIFEGEVWTQSQEVAIDYLRQRVDNGARGVLKHAKELCYRTLVDSLQDVILERIKRDVKQNA